MFTNFTRESLSARQLLLYKYWLEHEAPQELADADAIITEIQWINAMLDREEEGDALFAAFLITIKKESGKNVG